MFCFLLLSAFGLIFEALDAVELLPFTFVNVLSLLLMVGDLFVNPIYDFFFLILRNIFNIIFWNEDEILSFVQKSFC